ncbi:MAG: glycosyltransferase, partial [Planctomycetaceae bacterium]|nr:glycosyltransferase [Planctomycetaceae bacterium]
MDLIGVLSLAAFGLLSVDVLRQYLPLLSALKNADLSRPSFSEDSNAPRVQVILCLKGTDPFLDRCLHGLATQNYPQYGVTIVVDSEQDEALEPVLELQKKYGDDRLNVTFRRHLFPTCSRRASSLLSGFDCLNDDVDVVVLCDGDTVPHSNWLADLVQPLVAARGTAVSGNRWYAPETPTLGSLVRYFWNSLAVPRMYQDGIIWAGSMAIGRKIFRDPKFMEAMRTSFSEDTKLSGFLLRQNIHPVPLPDLPVINQETISLSSFWGFLVRQMLAARLHHPKWRNIFNNAMLVGLAMCLLLPISLLRGAETFLLWLTGLLFYGIITHTCIGMCEYRIRRFVKQTRDQTLSPYSAFRILMSLPALTVLGVVYPLAVLTAAAARSHVWRGVRYLVRDDGVVL